jgi:hypothetical protein
MRSALPHLILSLAAMSAFAWTVLSALARL